MARRAKGEGTLYQAKDKSWIYQYKVDGQRKTKRFQKKADARAYIEALTAASPVPSAEVIGPARQQNAATSEVITLGAWMDRWLENYAQAVKNHLLHENLIEGIRLPKAAKAEMRVLSREEQRRLMTTARLAPEPAAFGIIFDMFTGLRLGELCGLRWENVDMDSRSFLICETRNRLPNHDDSIAASTTVKTTPTTKTDNSRRRVFIMDELFHDFEMYRSIQMSIKEQDYSYNPEGYVFCQENGSPYEPRTYQDLFKRCVRQAGIPDANFHSLRHTFATRSLEQGMDAVTLSRLLGHANPSITLDKYGHALDDHKRISVAKLGDIYSVRPEQKESAPAPEEEPLPMEMKMGW